MDISKIPFEQEIQFDKSSRNNFNYTNTNKSLNLTNSIVNQSKQVFNNSDYTNNKSIQLESNCKNNFIHQNNNSEDEVPSAEATAAKSMFIKEYHSDVNLYGISLQNNQNCMRLAVSSLESPVPASPQPSNTKNNNNINNNNLHKITNQNYNNSSQLNRIEIIEYFEETDKLRKIAQADTLFPQTKLCWCPARETNTLLASTSDILRIHKYNELQNKLVPACDLSKKSKKNSGPLTSMDWNRSNSNLIGVCSVDTTCTIWDLQKQDIKTHLIAHDSEVFDINFGANENTFISTGADGSIRLFDLRALDTCSVLFESQDQTPITRVSWNGNDNNYIAAATQDKNFIFIIDVRVLNTPIAYLTYHTNLINAVAWAPSSFSHICSVSDDKTALIWDIQMIENRTEDPILCYKAESEINNCAWSDPHEDWIAVNAGNIVKMLKVI